MNKLHGLVAATHTPFQPDGMLNLAVIEAQAEHLLRTGVRAAFIGGTTGECHSLTVLERLDLAKRWSEVIRGSSLQLIVHVGANCLADARTLATQAQALNVTAIAALSPSYFKPRTIETLVDCCGYIAEAAPEVPFYFYDIPVMTGVGLPMPEFLEIAGNRVPTLTGIKFSNPDLMAYQQCLHASGGRFDMPWGTDEYLLAALAVGAVGGVGSSYNFAAPISVRLLNAFEQRDILTARQEQYRSAQVIARLAQMGYLGAAKVVMGFLGVPVGPTRLPNTNLTAEQSNRLRESLEMMGFFDWLAS